MERYTTAEKAKEEGEDKKQIITSEAYAICEFIEELSNKIERLRVSALMRK